MNQPWIYMYSPSRSPLPPPSPLGPSRSSQCTRSERLSHASKDREKIIANEATDKGLISKIYRDFNLLHWSLLKQFPLFVWLLFAVSSVPNFRPDTGGRRRSLIRVASSVALRGGTALLSLFTLLRLPAALYGVCPALRAVPALGCSTKARNKKLRLLFVPSPSERLRQPGA